MWDLSLVVQGSSVNLIFFFTAGYTVHKNIKMQYFTDYTPYIDYTYTVYM